MKPKNENPNDGKNPINQIILWYRVNNNKNFKRGDTIPVIEFTVNGVRGVYTADLSEYDFTEKGKIRKDVMAKLIADKITELEAQA